MGKLQRMKCKVLTPNVPDITVVFPEDEHLKHIIDAMALNVLDGGCAFEHSIMERGRGNPLFNFLFELGSKEHTYYVWRLYSFAQGDTLQRWRTEPYIMIAGSGRWIPPPLPAPRSPEHGKETTGTYAARKIRRMEAEQTLTDPQSDESEDMLRALTLERSQIKEAMGFALDNADAAGEPELKAFEKKEKHDLILPTSRWAREDNETDDEQKKSYSSGRDNAGGITFKTDEEDLKDDPSVRVQPENGIDEEQRQNLRRIEVDLIEYRESLEEQGMKNSEEIERKVAIHRKRLEADGLSGNQRVLLEKRERREDSRDSSRKSYRSESQGRSQSPPQKSTRERVKDHDLDKDRHRDRDRQQHDLNKDRERRTKSSSHERDDHDRSRERHRDWRRRGMR
ncbi:PREDICTED: protein RRC1-like isoform X2 [Camelina sativa]|uniref:Protein RRC1-like isoform X2 n=1 Tax=Camelina sativa TaxID=90675 RepID=A0ABM1RFC5_CAMSA|nr:PREDICTED: protein RRC1-like isoform X2 [Camelina sativa]